MFPPPILSHPSTKGSVGLHQRRSPLFLGGDRGSMRHDLMTSKHWRKRAEKIRAIATTTPDQITLLLIDLAEEYEKRAGKLSQKAAPESKNRRNN